MGWVQERSGQRALAAGVYINQGCVLEAQGTFAAAEELYQRAISTLTDVYGEDHHDVAAALSNLGSVLQVRM